MLVLVVIMADSSIQISVRRHPQNAKCGYIRKSFISLLNRVDRNMLFGISSDKGNSGILYLQLNSGEIQKAHINFLRREK
jgi:hypothetical protein